MAKKSLGYVKLEWVCPNCGTKNPGPIKTCTACGNPQPEDVVFIKAKQDIILSDPEEIAKAQSGPDIHCPFCGTRNVAAAMVCTQCGGDISEGTVRQSGQIMGAFQDQPQTIICSNCATENSTTNSFCENCGAALAQTIEHKPEKPTTSLSSPLAQKRKISPLLIAIPIIAIIACVIIGITLLSQKSEMIASVAELTWSRSISFEEFGPVSKVDWRENIPSDSELGSCEFAYHHTSDQPEVSSTEICGTPYVVDDGSGYGEVMEDCIYEVYLEKCEYTAEEWYFLETTTLTGEDQTPLWPSVDLGTNQRESRRFEEYKIVFEHENGILTYSTGSLDEFLQFTPGSEWILTVTGLNAITDIQPAN